MYFVTTKLHCNIVNAHTQTSNMSAKHRIQRLGSK